MQVNKQGTLLDKFLYRKEQKKKNVYQMRLELKRKEVIQHEWCVTVGAP